MPPFEGDEEKARVARVLNAVLLTTATVLVLSAPAGLFLFARVGGSLLITVGLLLVSVVAVLMMRRGYVREAAALFVAGIWLVVTILVLFSGGMTSYDMLYYVVITVMAGLLLGRRAAIFAAVVSVTVGLLMVAAEGLGHPPPRYFPAPSRAGWMNLTFGLILGTVTLNLTLKSLEEALRLGRQEIEERKRAEEALRDSESRFRQLAEHIGEVFWLAEWDTGRILYVSPAYEAIWDRPVERVLQGDDEWSLAVHPEDLERVKASYEADVASGDWVEEYRIVRPDGSVRWIRDRGFPVEDGEGRICRVAGIAEDITERKHTEEQLLQAQKMDSIGRLAGGVAHDFNNLLTAVMGSTDMLLTDFAEDDEARPLLEDIRGAAQRAMGLNQQLLAFSRKQVLKPVILDLNETLEQTRKILARLLGEDIQIKEKLSPVPLTVRADPTQLTQVIMNLALNARDAMPTGGTLSLETAKVYLDEDLCEGERGDAPGPYALLRVGDTGYGMSEETKSHLFEPFFTTKVSGKGTGLGLATVYGVVCQSGGFIRVETEMGKGSIFSVYLPYVQSQSEAVEESKHAVLAGGTGTILVAEDDGGVRRFACRVLRRAGFDVLEADCAEAALEVEAGHEGQIELLLTDVVMPRVNGPELAKRLTQRRPETRVLYMSGHTERLIAKHGILEPGVKLLSKPFGSKELLEMVNAILDY